MKSGDTYSRTFGTTIGSESLTTVFGMGTGVAFQIWSPERGDRPVRGTGASILVVDQAACRRGEPRGGFADYRVRSIEYMWPSIRPLVSVS